MKSNFSNIQKEMAMAQRQAKMTNGISGQKTRIKDEVDRVSVGLKLLDRVSVGLKLFIFFLENSSKIQEHLEMFKPRVSISNMLWEDATEHVDGVGQICLQK